eukprot:15110990-Alexandrium_andersonii.AAC.1
MVVVTASPGRAHDWSSGLSRGPFCAAVRAEREYGNENLPGACLGLILHGLFGTGEETAESVENRYFLSCRLAQPKFRGERCAGRGRQVGQWGPTQA